MKRERFRKLVAEAVDTIPARFRQHLQNIAIVVEDEPPDTLFGLYQGIPLPDRRWDYGNTLPDKISIYQFPIEDACETEEEIVTEVGETLIHEVGHFFGLSEDELQEIEDRYWHDRTGEWPAGEDEDELDLEDEDDDGESS